MSVFSSKVKSTKEKKVGVWLLIGVGMLLVQILLGGITRLTGSGLSITEWNVVTGTLPPLNASEWATAFSKYQQTPQYRLLNTEFTIADFKFIFFWEWLHRLWARLMGVVFAIGFLYFLFTRKFKREMIKPLLILFLLGALQGAVGWIMVASGLVGDAVYVQPVKLALHFILAMGLLGYTFWFALQLLVPKIQVQHHGGSLKSQLYIIVCILFFQLLYGALMAGHKAATAAATWPDINGQFIPMGWYNTTEGGLNFINNKILIHFIHRGLAYLLCVFTLVWTMKAYKTRGTSFFQQTKWLPLLIILLQLFLGIVSVLSSVHIVPNRWGVFEWMAQLHQIIAILFLLAILWMLFLQRNIISKDR